MLTGNISDCNLMNISYARDRALTRIRGRDDLKTRGYHFRSQDRLWTQEYKYKHIYIHIDTTLETWGQREDAISLSCIVKGHAFSRYCFIPFISLNFSIAIYYYLLFCSCSVPVLQSCSLRVSVVKSHRYRSFSPLFIYCQLK